jgi:hypothetical protein
MTATDAMAAIVPTVVLAKVVTDISGSIGKPKKRKGLQWPR